MTQQYLDKKAKTRGVTLGLLKKNQFPARICMGEKNRVITK